LPYHRKKCLAKRRWRLSSDINQGNIRLTDFAATRKIWLESLSNYGDTDFFAMDFEKHFIVKDYKLNRFKAAME